MMGGPTDDLIVGERGTDLMNGQEGDDKIYHAFLNSTATDGSKDLVICGDGQDEAWINSIVDGDWLVMIVKSFIDYKPLLFIIDVYLYLVILASYLELSS